MSNEEFWSLLKGIGWVLQAAVVVVPIAFALGVLTVFALFLRRRRWRAAAICFMLAVGCAISPLAIGHWARSRFEARAEPAPAAAALSQRSVAIVGTVDDPAAVSDWLRAEYPDQPGWPLLAAVAAGSVDGGPAHPRLTLVYVADGDFCGSGGCTLYVLEEKDDALVELSRMTISHAPIRVLRSHTNGMPDISVRVRSDYYPGPGPKFVALPFDGSRYALNPTGPPALLLAEPIDGDVVISEADADRAFGWGRP